MAPDFKTFLATEVISEQRTISYRNLSRALKVHVNAAKCMLYEFYEKENKKKSGSINATYLVSGKKIAGSSNGTPNPTNGDVPMPSSPPVIPSSSVPAASQATEQLDERYQVPVKSITLCREEQLQSVRDKYEHVSSVHIYSLSPVRVQDLATLTDTGRAVFADYHAKQDPLIHNKDYGIIQNPYVWRRKGKRPVNVGTEPAQPKLQQKAQAKPQPKKEEKPNMFSKSGTKTDMKKEEAKREATPAPASRPSSRDSTATQDSKSKPTLKKESSSLFKAFAKRPSEPKLERNNSSNSDAKMSGMDLNDDEGESEDDSMFLDTGTSKGKKRPSDIQREKEERQAKLRKMMEDDDEAESAVPRVSDTADVDADPPAAKSDEDPDAPAGDGENEDWPDSDTERKATAQVKEDEGPKRRRGKRKVMKKKTMKDDEGFLVTREEEAFESFSEDEPEKPPAKKPAFPAKGAAPEKKQSQTQKSSAPKGSAAGGKKDIMSFFGKK